MKKLLASVAVLGLCILLLLGGGAAYLSATMPPYRDSVGDDNYTEKMTGLYLVQQAAAQGDNLIIYGSSELRTLEIPTHPANFFAGKREGFQVNLVGRGSCQSLIHALSIAASGDALAGRKVALITSPQSYVPEGIAPDLFMANFSGQQYLELLAADDLSDDVKQYLSARVTELFARYEQAEGVPAPHAAIRYRAQHGAKPTAFTAARHALLVPFYRLSRFLYGVGDLYAARSLLYSLEDAPPSAVSPGIDWEAELQQAVTQAQQMSANNGFGMLSDYYTTYIGTRLGRQEGRDADLDYSVSREYDDLRILFEICRQKGVEPLFIHVPLHAQWSDYTGFTGERRQRYYDQVRSIAEAYGVETLDLTGYEYEEYFLCDVMHLGWKGWLAVDRALIDYYYAD